MAQTARSLSKDVDNSLSTTSSIAQSSPKMDQQQSPKSIRETCFELIGRNARQLRRMRGQRDNIAVKEQLLQSNRSVVQSSQLRTDLVDTAAGQSVANADNDIGEIDQLEARMIGVRTAVSNVSAETHLSSSSSSTSVTHSTVTAMESDSPALAALIKTERMFDMYCRKSMTK